MFIRLTSKYKRLPVWINPQFVASVEKCEHGGCVVGPVGAGVDFEVLEAPERVLALLAAPDSQEVAPPPDEFGYGSRGGYGQRGGYGGFGSRGNYGGGYGGGYGRSSSSPYKTTWRR